MGFGSADGVAFAVVVALDLGGGGEGDDSSQPDVKSRTVIHYQILIE